MQVFVAAFVFLVGSAVAMAVAQFASNHAAPWISMGLSVGAVACTVVALFSPTRRP